MVLSKVNEPDCSCINNGHPNPMINLSPMVMLDILLVSKRKDTQVKFYHLIVYMACTGILNSVATCIPYPCF
jgi:hypothetical protein